jgi:hypothetical protein
MISLQKTLGEKIQIDKEIEEMKKHSIDFSDIPQMEEYSTGKSRFGYEEFLSKLPPDIVKEMAKRRLEEMKNSGLITEPETSVEHEARGSPSVKA